MTTGTNHSPATTGVDPLKIELELLVTGEHGDPHHVLGVHGDGDSTIVRGYRPGAEGMAVVLPDGNRVEMALEHPAGVFGAQRPKDVPVAPWWVRTCAPRLHHMSSWRPSPMRWRSSSPRTGQNR
jgi:hypothetical protein